MGMVKPPLDLDALIARIDELVRLHGAVPRAELRMIKRHLPAIAERLAARGLEVGSSIRRPLETQIVDLADEGFVPKKGLERRVAGASSREVQEATRRLVERGALVEVIRESGAGFVAASGDADVIDASDLNELLRCLTKVEKLVRRARPARGMRPTLLRADVTEPLARWIEPARKPIKDSMEAPLVETLTREIRKRFRENPLPIRIPDLSRAMGAPADAAKRALIDGAARGLFALEPESGMGRLSGEDAEAKGIPGDGGASSAKRLAPFERLAGPSSRAQAPISRSPSPRTAGAFPLAVREAGWARSPGPAGPLQVRRPRRAGDAQYR
jgi:hypothetical protein